MSADAIGVRTLTDGGQRAEDVAGWLAEFIGGATHSLDIAIYDVDLDGEAENTLVAAVRAAVERGVAVRLVHNVEEAPRVPIPPPSSDDVGCIAELGVETRPIHGVPDLMHHKYVVRDRASVWTGSTNWTDDSWMREENVIVTVDASEVAEAYASDFAELWQTRTVAGTGSLPPRAVPAGASTVSAWFCPQQGRRLSHRIADVIASARRRIRICSPVLTSGPILGTLAEVAAERRVDLAGVVDATQMRQVLDQWRANGNSAWKTPTLVSIVERAEFGGKESTPYSPGSVHDYMHAKITVADDVSFVGSYNLSHSGEENAENVLEIVDAELADQLAGYADAVRERYTGLDLGVSRARAG